MKAAVILEGGRLPVYGDFEEPSPLDGEQRIAVSAAALSPVVKGRASGAHYSAPGTYPFIAGMDGVGRMDDGRRVYFILPRAPFGAMAERTVCAAAQCVPVPDAVDDITAAALPNPGLASWAALRERARFVPGETVLVNGATGTSGRLAVQIAKYLGAKTVIAAGRNASALESLKGLGADETVVLSEDADELDRAFKVQFARGIDVVLDLLWGKSAERILVAGVKAGEEGVPIRFVQIGHSSGAAINLPAQAIRSAAVEITGSGLGSIPLPRIVAVMAEILQAAARHRFEFATEAVPLFDVEGAWNRPTMPRVVFTTGGS
ncbi:MAG: zinc-binding alcohol dehydrogenase family protein [Alphaproteobacteria bacterium]|nr:zinc-binding alcohol dehydrogenase family protein [Alphaproteobacteria bacterium]